MKRLFALVLGGAFLAPCPSAAATLEERVHALESRDAELYHTLKEKKTAGRMSAISERISLSGLVEVAAAYERADTRDNDTETASDLVLATAQLGLEAEVAEHLGAFLILLYEDAADSVIEVDEATLDYGRGSWSARLGRQYVPFGTFPSHFVSSPLTSELGETQQVAALVGYGNDVWNASGFLFRGDAEKADGSDHLRDWGVGLTLTPVAGVELGASFLSDLADTGAELATDYTRRVAGWSAHAVAAWGSVEASIEFLGAAGSFDTTDLDEDGDGSGDRPFAWNAELAWDGWEAVELAARAEGSRELFGQPEFQAGLCVSWGPWEGVSFSLEYLRGTFDAGFGDGLDTRDLVTGQAAAEF